MDRMLSLTTGIVVISQESSSLLAFIKPKKWRATINPQHENNPARPFFGRLNSGG
jgi:hypothetical protein